MLTTGGLFPFWLQQDPETFNLVEWYWDHPTVRTIAGILALLLACLLALYLVRKARHAVIRPLIQKSRFSWDDVFLDASFFRWLSYVLVALVAYAGIDLVPGIDPPESAYTIVRSIALSFMVIFGMLALGSLLTAGNTLYSRRAAAKSRPIKGYIQIGKIFLYSVGSIVAIATLFDKNPTTFLVGLGGMTAVLLLIFKDTILGLVASVQLTSNDMVQVGDWIEMPSVGADGDVIDVALHTVKVQNWDKTISTIPTHKLITDSFKNWRGMQASGGRRIKRSINLDMSTIRFLDEDDIERFGEFALLKDYIAGKRAELEDYNREHDSEESAIVNARRLTNVGTFRAYTINYLRSHPMVNRGMTFLVRQLQPTENGLPLEIYIFTSTTNWNAYEAIQADLFDHLLAILPEFGLRVFQRPSGGDFALLAEGNGLATGAGSRRGAKGQTRKTGKGKAAKGQRRGRSRSN